MAWIKNVRQLYYINEFGKLRFHRNSFNQVPMAVSKTLSNICELFLENAHAFLKLSSKEAMNGLNAVFWRAISSLTF